MKCSGAQHLKSKTFNCAAEHCNLKPILCEACAKKSKNEIDKKGKPLRICRLCWITEKQNNSDESDSKYLPGPEDKINNVVMVYSASRDPGKAKNGGKNLGA